MGKIQDVIDFAISNETEAFEFYMGVAEQVKDPGLKSIFQDLAREESQHKKFLQTLFSGDLIKLFFGEVEDYHVADSVEKPHLSMSMKPVEGIALAMKREEEAVDLYMKLSEKTTDSEKKTMFLELSKMEQGHKARLEEIYTNMAFAEVW